MTMHNNLASSYLKVVYIMGHEVVSCQRVFFSMVALHGNTFVVRFLKKTFLKPFDPY